MKSTLYIAIVVLLSFGSTLAQNEDIEFDDSAFKQALIAEGVDVDKNEEISYDEAKSVTALDISNNMISQMTEIQYFTNLEILDCDDNQLTALDVSKLTKLKTLICQENQLTTLKVGGLSNLEALYCRTNQLTTLDVSGLTNLVFLFCEGNQLTTLDVSGLTNLEQLFCYNNKLTTMDVSGLTNLDYLFCEGNQLTTMDVSGLTNLDYLYCYDNKLTTLDVSGLTNLDYLYCYDNKLTTLDVSGLTNLQGLLCFNNHLIMIDLRQTSLGLFDARFNPLQCVVIDSGGMPGYDYDLPDSLYTTEPCLATFEALTHLVEKSDLMNFQRNILLTTMQSAEGLCALGSGEAATLMLWTMAGTVQLWQQWGAIAPDVALEIKEAINLLIEGIQSGDVDCSPDFSPDSDLWDGFSSWFNLDDSPHAGNGSYVTTHTLSPATTVRLYPNPTKGLVNLSQPAQEVHEYNLLGQHLFQARNVIHLDLSAYKPGVYVIRIGNGRKCPPRGQTVAGVAKMAVKMK